MKNQIGLGVLVVVAGSGIVRWQSPASIAPGIQLIARNNSNPVFPGYYLEGIVQQFLTSTGQRRSQA